MTNCPPLLRRLPRCTRADRTVSDWPGAPIGPRTAVHTLPGPPQNIIAADQAASPNRHSLPGRRPTPSVVTARSTLSP